MSNDLQEWFKIGLKPMDSEVKVYTRFFSGFFFRFFFPPKNTKTNFCEAKTKQKPRDHNLQIHSREQLGNLIERKKKE